MRVSPALTRALTSLFLSGLFAAGLVIVNPAPAHASWTEHVAYRRQGSVCSSDGTTMTVGASVFQKELGKNGVRQFRIEFKLYDTDPRAPGIRSPWLRRTKYSARFPNDKKNYWWDGPTGATQKWTFQSNGGEYWMDAKLTWDRPNKRDWNYTLPVAYCAWSAGRAGVQR